ncbi:MAG: hypothetical protein DMF11_07895 [Verrucomicrobia bacterium]|nr:MAG: hypothetical protein DMF11_07895 [Verrucomicrobiota bacterium]
MCAAIVADQQNTGRPGHKGECMLIDMHGTCATAVGITAGGIVPDSSRERRKPNLERVKEDPFGVVRIHGDSLVVPVLRVIAGAVNAVSERAALGTFHIIPVCATVCGSPGTQLAAVAIATATVVIPNDGLALCVNVVRVAWRHSYVDSTQLISGIDVNKRRAAAGVHRCSCSVRAAGDLISKHEAVSIAGD